jgi:hypothetical protein
MHKLNVGPNSQRSANCGPAIRGPFPNWLGKWISKDGQAHTKDYGVADRIRHYTTEPVVYEVLRIRLGQLRPPTAASR